MGTHPLVFWNRILGDPPAEFSTRFQGIHKQDRGSDPGAVTLPAGVAPGAAFGGDDLLSTFFVVIAPESSAAACEEGLPLGWVVT